MPRKSIGKNMLKSNLAFITVNRQPQDKPTSYYFISESIVSNGFIRSDSVSIDNFFPLYLYPETENQIGNNVNRVPNLNEKILNEIGKKIKITHVAEPEERKIGSKKFAPVDLLDYIYAILHSPSYRNKFKEFLKIDFPKVPYPKDQETFWKFVELGGKLRQLHLLESEKVEQFITTYPQDGDNVVRRKYSKSSPGWELTDEESEIGRVWINDEQYFDLVPKKAWEFYIGVYQPAQQWLKDRKERQLSLEDIMHYQKIIVALTETDRLMKEIDEVAFE
jgi:predicted helicase